LPEILQHRKRASAEVPRVHLEHADEPAAIGPDALVELCLQDALDGRNATAVETAVPAVAPECVTECGGSVREGRLDCLRVVARRPHRAGRPRLLVRLAPVDPA